MSEAGWGVGEWGTSFWGVGSGPLKLIDAQPVRENVVRLFFNAPMKFTGILDPSDASSSERYDITPIAGTLNGDDPRDVDPIIVELTEVAGAGGTQIDVTVDRPFSPYPSRYRISVNQLQSKDGALLDPDFTSFEFDGLLGERGTKTRDLALPIRDIANPQTRDALLDPLPVTDDVGLLGNIPIDENGDYAFDEGITSIKKRIFRRLVTSKGHFAHLPDYGVGFPEQAKRLNTFSKRTEMAAEAEKQILQEPDVEQVSVRIINDTQNPGLFRVQIRVKTKVSGDAVNMDIPFAPIA